MPAYPSLAATREVALLDLLDTALDKGVVVQGDATISVADVDLVFLGLKLVLCSVETMEQWRMSARGGSAGSDGESRLAETPVKAVSEGPDRAGLPSPGVIPNGGFCPYCHAEAKPKHPAVRGPSRRDPASASGGGRMTDSSGPGAGAARLGAGATAADPDKVERGLAKLVLTLVELVRRLLERQGIRRMEGGSLSEAEIERMGQALQRLEQKMKELKGVFGLQDQELNLNLGPLGDLM